jgi:hypothetical protein
LLDGHHPDVATSLNNLVDILHREGKSEEALTLLQRNSR